LAAASVLCVSCDNSAIEPSQSLVGAKELPSAEELSRETFYVSLGGGPEGGNALSYEWRPDNSLTVMHSYSDGGLKEVVKGKENLRFSPEAANQARQLFWRVRPAKLGGVEQDVRPIGCERGGPHDFGVVTVGFIREGPAEGIEDDEIGLFELPATESCKTPAAIEARRVVLRALEMFPKGRVSAEFERLSLTASDPLRTFAK